MLSESMNLVISTMSKVYNIQIIRMTEEDDVVKHLMCMLGNKKELQLKSASGKTIKLSLEDISGNLENQLSLGNTSHNEQECINFQKALLEEEFTAPQITPVKPKKISLSNKYKNQPANQTVLNYISQQEKKDIPLTTFKPIDATQSIEFLKQNHPEEKQHLEIISKRMIELEKMEKDKIKLDEEISSILSSSFSNSLRHDNSIDFSMLSFSTIGANDPLCQIFNNYLHKTSVSKKSQTNKMPSFLFLYSQPMLDIYNYELNEQINYFQEENIIQKILKQCKIDYIREQATIEKFHYWIKQNISILHFCGHGVEDKENYLLFESHSGLSVKMDAEKLQALLGQLNTPLELVFVASCHSESTGKIFKQAGAVHVICVRDNYPILDEACQEFAKIFYHSVINNKMTICKAFSFAKKQISLSEKFSKHESAKFIMIKDHSEEKCNSELDLGKQGQFHDLTSRPYYRKNLPSRVENFIPRPKDLHQILKLLHHKNRFITVLGCSGIGKSTLVRQLVRYVQFRNIFKDGVIYLDIRSCEKMLKIFQVISMELFESSQVKLNKTFQENVQKVVKQLYDRCVLIVFDNCHNILAFEGKNQFKRLIGSIMKNCDNVYFVFTNRSSLGRQIDYCSEKVYQLTKLNNVQAQMLFFQRAPRNIDKKELEDFFRIQQCKDLTKHPFFQFLNGHPEAICMTASLLSERSLNELYELLMKPNLQLTEELPKQNLEDENMGINPLVETAMKISLNVLRNKHKQASQMIKTLSLLPVGVDSETMAKLFGAKWKDTVKKLIHHSLVHCKDAGGPKYFSVHPQIIVYVQSEIGNEEKLKLHERISDEFLKRIQKIYKFIGTLSHWSQRAHEQFLTEQQNYKAIIYREVSFCGDKTKIRKLYNSLFENEFSDEDIMKEQEEYIEIKGEAVEGIRKKIVYNERILQPTKKQPIQILMVYYVTILFVTKSPTCNEYIDYGIFLARKKKKLLMEANLLRIRACLYLIKNKCRQAKQFFLKSWELYAIEGCGLGSASCQGAVGYIRLLQEEYAMAKKNLENALKYYDQIPHSFGKHYINRWLCSLKSKINRTQKELISHRQQAEKLLKGAKVSLRSNTIHNTQQFKHKLGVFVFRFTFDNISLFLQASFLVDVRPKIINQPVLKKPQIQQGKFLQDVVYEAKQEEIHFNSNHKKQFPKK